MPTNETVMIQMEKLLKSAGLDVFEVRLTSTRNRYTLQLHRDLGSEIFNAEELNNAVFQFWTVLSMKISGSDFAKELKHGDSAEVKKLKKLNEELLKYKTHFNMEVEKERRVNEEFMDTHTVIDTGIELRNQGHNPKPRASYDTRCGNCRAYVCTPSCTGRKDL